MLADGGLLPVSVIAVDLAPFATDDSALDRFKRGVDAANALGAPMLLSYCFAGIPEGIGREAALETAGQRARLYGEAAGDVGIALEPIGRTQLMGGPTAALDIAARSGRANVGIMMDTFHSHVRRFKYQAPKFACSLASGSEWPRLGMAGDTVIKRLLIML